MSSDRQKYNFLAAWVKQFDQARDENDDLASQVEQLTCESVARYIHEVRDDLEVQIGALGERLTRFESALAQLDYLGSEDACEESSEDDDGDNDTDDSWDESEVGGGQEGHRRVAAAVDGAGRRPQPGRGVELDTERNKQFRRVRHGTRQPQK